MPCQAHSRQGELWHSGDYEGALTMGQIVSLSIAEVLRQSRFCSTCLATVVPNWLRCTNQNSGGLW